MITLSVVTVLGAIYTVVSNGRNATAVKTAIREGSESKIAVGDSLGDGSMVVVTPKGVYGYNLEKGEFQSRSSAVVALFLDPDTARDCLASQDLKVFDLRWRDTTKTTLATFNSPDKPPDSGLFTFTKGEYSFQ